MKKDHGKAMLQGGLKSDGQKRSAYSILRGRDCEFPISKKKGGGVRKSRPLRMSVAPKGVRTEIGGEPDGLGYPQGLLPMPILAQRMDGVHMRLISRGGRVQLERSRPTNSQAAAKINFSRSGGRKVGYPPRG